LAGLGPCRKLLVCDHFEVGVPGKKGWHGGRLSQHLVSNYRRRLALLRDADWAAGVEVLELEDWHGFGLATKRALELVSTPLVCVVQHDLAFLRRVDLRPTVEELLAPHATATDAREVERGGMAAEAPTEPVNYVYFMRSSQQNYRANLRARTKLEVGPPVVRRGRSGPLSLTRMPQFFDGTHLARAEWYRGIFARPLLRGKVIARGQFTDNVLGFFMLALAKLAPELARVAGAKGGGTEVCVSQGVLDVCAEFGCWLWSDESEPLVCHLNGRTFMSGVEATELAAARGLRVRDTPSAGAGGTRSDDLFGSRLALEEGSAAAASGLVVAGGAERLPGPCEYVAWDTQGRG
jgi:hypothetical protein